MLLASLANFLTHNDYPYFRLEVGLIVVGILGLAGLMAAWYIPQRQWGRSFLEGLLAAVFVDLNTYSVWPIFVGGIGVGLFTAWRSISLLALMAIMGSIVFVTTIAGVGGRPTWIETEIGTAPTQPASGRPAVVHLILDEHIGIEGLRLEDSEAAALANQLSAAYQEAGFTVYGGAYSEHYHTANSIPYMLNYGQRLGLSARNSGVEAGPTEHLQALVDQGYRLKVLQARYADICSGSRFQQCTTYDQSGLGPTLAVPISTGERVELILHKSLTLSIIVQTAVELWDGAARGLSDFGIDLPTLDNLGRSSSVGAFGALTLLETELTQARPGDAFFAHLLLPHHPYVLNRDCRYAQRPWLSLWSIASVPAKQSAYREQLRCTMAKINDLLKALSRSPARSNNIVIIHGDHGSRIAKRLNHDNQETGQFDDDELIAAFSTLFAVRTSAPNPGYQSRRAPVSTLLREFAESDFRALPNPFPRQNHTVVLADGNWKPVRRVPLPTWWAKGLDRPAVGQ